MEWSKKYQNGEIKAVAKIVTTTKELETLLQRDLSSCHKILLNRFAHLIKVSLSCWQLVLVVYDWQTQEPVNVISNDRDLALRLIKRAQSVNSRIVKTVLTVKRRPLPILDASLRSVQSDNIAQVQVHYVISKHSKELVRDTKGQWILVYKRLRTNKPSAYNPLFAETQLTSALEANGLQEPESHNDAASYLVPSLDHIIKRKIGTAISVSKTETIKSQARWQTFNLRKGKERTKRLDQMSREQYRQQIASVSSGVEF